MFDIAHHNALAIIEIDEDKAFLLAQREKGRQGSLVGVDLSLLKKEKAQSKKKEKHFVWIEKQHEEMTRLDRSVVLEASESSSSGEKMMDSEVKGAAKQRKINILTPSVLSSLDRT